MFFGLYQNGHINYVTVKRSSRVKLSIVFIVQKWRLCSLYHAKVL